jgi:predicted RND superfamily exporter protein
MLQSLSRKAAEVGKVIARSGNDEKARNLERQVFEAANRALQVLASGMEDEGFGVDDLPVSIRGRYVSGDGRKYAVIAFPNGNLNEKSFLFRHVEELLSVDPGMTGHAITNKVFTEMVHRGFAQAIILSSIAVFLLVLLDLRSFRGLVLALVPVLIAMGWLNLVMFLAGLKYNYGNLMALPILIGSGVDYGAHLAHRANQEGSVTKAAMTTGKAIALSGLTTLIGFGSLIVGNHWGVRSLGLLLVMGISFSLIAALVVLPGMLRGRERGEGPRALGSPGERP